MCVSEWKREERGVSGWHLSAAGGFAYTCCVSFGGGGYWKKCGEDVLRCRCFCLHIMTQTFGHRVLKEVSTILFSQSFFFP